MNRIIKVSRTNDPLLSIRVEVYDEVMPRPVETLALTPDEAIELHAILSYFNPNQWISSVTGSAAPPIVPGGGAS